jgi:phosphatidylglycerophosphatase A
MATVFGIGYIGKGGGTLAAFCCCLVWYYLGHCNNNNIAPVVVTVIILFLGIWSAGKVESQWGIDSNRVVIDEVAGMCITLLFVPVTVIHVFIGLVLFRFFDIVKPLFIKKMERLPGGWGVMMDDLVAGFYAHIILQVIIWSKLTDL